MEQQLSFFKKVRGTVRKTNNRRAGSTVEKKEESDKQTSKVKTARVHKKGSDYKKKPSGKSKSSFKEIKTNEKRKDKCEFSKSIDMEETPPKKENNGENPRRVWVGDEVAKSFLAHASDMDNLRKEFAFLESFCCNKSANAFHANKERNRCEKQVVFDENRIVLNRPGHEDLNYINASLITAKDFPNKIIVSQLPKMENESFVEDFWYMIYQENISLIYILSTEETIFKTPTKLFIPVANEYQYVSKMFINTRKVEVSNDLRNYTIEVLPEGNSDAVICQVHHYVAWNHGQQPKKLRYIIQMIHQFLTEKEISSAGVCVTSLLGSGRACSFLAALIAIAQLNKGIEPNIFEILKNMKLQRQGATENLMQYLAIYQIVLEYIKRKVSVKEVKQGVGKLIKQFRNFSAESDMPAAATTFIPLSTGSTP